jgi:hypothetical protein
MRPLLVAMAVLIGLTAATAHGERRQHGNLIVTLDGGFAPRALPRDRPAPVAVELKAGLRTSDHTPVPRVTGVELGIPRQGVISTRGLPTCKPRRIRNTTTAKALEACGPALIGSGRMVAQVKIPSQPAFAVHARLLAFNGRVNGRRAVIVHGLALRPPSVVVLPFLIERRPGKFGTVFSARLPDNLGPWPRFARFEMSFYRRYTFRGRERSYISASCPLPKRVPFAPFSFAKASLTLADGRQISMGIARTCRAQ